MGGGVILTIIICLFIIICAFLVMGKNMPFQYNCFISRLPIFLFGIFMYGKFTNSSIYFNKKWLRINLVLGLILLILDRIIPVKIGFISTSLIAPALIYGLFLLHNYMGKSLQRGIQFIGQYSLEFYVANLIIHVTMGIIPGIPGVTEKAIFYIVGNIVIAFILIPLNRLITNSILKICILR